MELRKVEGDHHYTMESYVNSMQTSSANAFRIAMGVKGLNMSGTPRGPRIGYFASSTRLTTTKSE